jgi:multidrug transporter EmrE-like cation transporter
MKANILTIILLSVTLSASAQVVLKSGMSDPSVQRALTAPSLTSVIAAIVGTPRVLAGILLYVAGAAVWVLVLARVEVSFAYPFVGLGCVLTMLGGWLLLGESLTIARGLGTILVASGVVLIARS